MSIRIALVVGFCFALAAQSFGQNSSSESQTLQAILAEIRGIHEDMRVTETSQILLTELEMQQGVVNRAQENVDNARAKLADVQRDLKLVASDLKRAEDHLNQTSDVEERKHIAEDIERHNANAAALKTEEQGRLTILQAMESRLKGAQDSLESIEDELKAVIARLRPQR